MTADAAQFRRDDGVLEIPIRRPGTFGLPLALWAVLLVVILAFGLARGGSERWTVVGVVAVLVGITTYLIVDQQRLALLIDGRRIGYRSGMLNRRGKWWTQLDDIVEVHIDARAPYGGDIVTSYLVIVTDGGMPKTQAMAIGSPSNEVKSLLRDRWSRGLRLFACQRTTLGADGVAVVDDLLRPYVTSGTRWMES